MSIKNGVCDHGLNLTVKEIRPGWHQQFTPQGCLTCKGKPYGIPFRKGVPA